MKAERFSWWLYIVGSLLVFASWMDIVPTALGWIGWLIALLGWAMADRSRPTDRPQPLLSKAEQLEKLDELRRRTVITDDEFQKEKSRLLDSSV